MEIVDINLITVYLPLDMEPRMEINSGKLRILGEVHGENTDTLDYQLKLKQAKDNVESFWLLQFLWPDDVRLKSICKYLLHDLLSEMNTSKVINESFAG